MDRLLPFMNAIRSAGSTEQEEPRRFFKVRKNLSHKAENGVEMLIVPSETEEFKVTVMVDYNSPVLGTQHARMESLEAFNEEFASCRTFVFLKGYGQSRRTGTHQRRRHRQCRGAC